MSNWSKLVSALGPKKKRKKKATFASSVDVPVGELNSTCLRISFNHKSLISLSNRNSNQLSQWKATHFQTLKSALRHQNIHPKYSALVRGLG